MSTLTLPISSPNRLKRPFSEMALDSSFDNAAHPPTVTEPKLATEAVSSSSTNDIQCFNPDPLDESGATRSIEQASATMTPTPATSNTPNPAKKRAKLTGSEKEAKRQEKEAKEKDKAEQKAKKDEEKRAKDAEKEKKRLEKEEQVKAKEAEKKRKEEEKDKKQKVCCRPIESQNQGTMLKP